MRNLTLLNIQMEHLRVRTDRKIICELEKVTFEKLIQLCAEENKRTDKSDGIGKGGKKDENILWLKSDRPALSLYIRKWLSSEGVEKTFRHDVEDDKVKAQMKEMFRSDSWYIMEMTPVEFGFLISGIGEGKGKGKGKNQRAERAERYTRFMAILDVKSFSSG